MIAWFARNHVAANLLMISIVLAGTYSLFTQIPLEVFPNSDPDTVSVNVSLRGATPEDVEQGVTIRIEQAIEDLQGIKKISSRSSEGSANVSVEIEPGYNERDLLADIKTRVDAINTFPADAEKPVVSLAQRRHGVIVVTLSSEHGEKETREYAEVIRDQLLQLPNVTQVELSGVRNFEIAIEVDQHKLRQYQLTLNSIAQAVGNSSSDISAGSIKTQGAEVLLRSKGQAYRKDEFAKIVIKRSDDGSIIRLGDVATVSDSFEETPVRTRFNGKDAAFLEVYRIGKQSAIEVADEVKTFIEQQKSTLPQGFELSYWDDDSYIVKSRIATLTSNAIQGGILVLALLTLFLHPSIAFWVFIGIPVSFMGAFLAMPFFGVTINVMSLFGFILVLGIVVDDAIVTGENVYTHLKKSDSSEQAVIKGTQEVATPVTFGILTTVAAFMPIAFMEGGRASWFSAIPVVVIPVLLFSLIESKFVLPAHLKYIKLRKDESGNRFNHFQQRFADGFEQAIIRYYQPVLAVALKNKLTVIVLFVATLLIIVSLIMGGWTKYVNFPRIPSETVRVNVLMPTGTPFEVTNKHIVTMEKHAKFLQEKYRNKETGDSLILNILATTGGRGGTSNKGGVRFEITPAEKRLVEIDARQLANEWRKLIGVIPGAEHVSYRAEIGRSSDPIEVQLRGQSITQLEEIAEKVKQRLATYPTVSDIADSLSDGKQELQIELTDQGQALGLTRVEVLRQVRTAFYGAQVQRIQRGRDDVRVMVRLPLSERSAVANLNTLLIRTPSGNNVPLAHVATLLASKSPSSIYRIDQNRTVNVIADVNKETTNMTRLQADLSQYLDQLLLQYPQVNYSLEGEAREQRDSFNSLLWGIVIVFFVIYALLAIPLRSYIQPLIVMSVIPFGLIGAVVGHWIMGMNLTMMSLLGMLALMGIVVNDSLVLVDYINKKRREGGELLQAVSQAGVARFRPVMLTSLTTFIGLMPLLFEKSTQAQFLIPMAVSLGFGIIFATFITLLLVPVNYMLISRIINK